MDVPVVPGLAEILAMVDGDAVEPGAHRRFATKLILFPESFKENIMSCVLCFLRVAEKSQS